MDHAARTAHDKCDVYDVSPPQFEVDKVEIPLRNNVGNSC